MPAELAEVDELEDIEDLADGVWYDSEAIPAEAYSDFPDDYVIAICSLRGTGKSALLAFYCLNGLSNGEKVFTNLPLFPERAGIKNVPNPLILEQLLSFDPVLSKALIAIEELHTWYQKKRSMSTSAIMADEFLRQLRKKVLRVAFTDQSVSLPRDVERDVDLFIQGLDMRWTDFGRENNIPKGVMFLYQATDYSARITGRRFNTWHFTLTFANRLWDKFDSYKIFDPFQAFRKYKVVGGEMEYDIAQGKMFTGGERDAYIDESALKRRFLLLETYWRSFEVDLLDVAGNCKGVLKDDDKEIELSVERLRTAISQLRGKKRKAAEESYNGLRLLAQGGEMAQYRVGKRVIALRKPVILESESDTNGEAIDAETADMISDLYATGYKEHQIANKLHISERIVNETLSKVGNE